MEEIKTKQDSLVGMSTGHVPRPSQPQGPVILGSASSCAPVSVGAVPSILLSSVSGPFSAAAFSRMLSLFPLALYPLSAPFLGFDPVLPCTTGIGVLVSWLPQQSVYP